MKLPLSTDYPPMEAQLVRAIPEEDGWVYEPKWDGFRCIAFREGEEVALQSKSGKPLGRYFPDMVDTLRGVRAGRFVLDGELVIPVDGALMFDELLLRIHPAASRVQKLAASHPAHFVAFDLLVDDQGRNLTEMPLVARREALQAFAGKYLKSPALHLSPHTDDVELARRWLAGELGGLDGIIAKRAELPYRSGDRTGMKKIKRMRTAECVVGGFRWASSGRTVGSLLLGLFGDDRKLHHVGFCGSLSGKVRPQADDRLIPLRGGEGFTGRAPGGPSRWRKEGSGEWEPVRPEVVVEVEYDHFTGGRFRHGTRFLRWRPDKAPEQCLMEQVEHESSSAMGML